MTHSSNDHPVLAVILSAAKNPAAAHIPCTARTFHQPNPTPDARPKPNTPFLRLHRRSGILILLIAIFTASVHAQPTVLKLTLHDTHPARHRPIHHRGGLQDAATQHARAVLLTLGTPGGLLSSTRDIVAAIESSPVPVIVYISPLR